MMHHTHDSASSGSILLYFVVFLLIVGAISLAYQSMVLTSQTFVLNSRTIAERDAMADSAVAVILSQAERTETGYAISRDDASALAGKVVLDQAGSRSFDIDFDDEGTHARFKISFSIDERTFSKELKVPYQ
ncbi:MAG: hypothetical protein ACI4SY_05645 [Sutterella sp.]